MLSSLVPTKVCESDGNDVIMYRDGTCSIECINSNNVYFGLRTGLEWGHNVHLLGTWL